MDRTERIDELERKLREWDARLDARKEALEARSDEKKAQLERKRAELKEKRARFEARLSAARKEAGGGWERTSRELGDAWNEFKSAAQDVVGALKS